MLKIFSAGQMRDADRFTIEQEPVSSFDLMERAGMACVGWITKRYEPAKVAVLCGTGNNGGDGLVIARELRRRGFDVSVVILPTGKKATVDFTVNLGRLGDVPVLRPRSADELKINDSRIVVDAIFGTGLKGSVRPEMAQFIEAVNSFEGEVISIDLPSGMLCDGYIDGSAIVHARHTLTFQLPKLSLLMPVTGNMAGEFHLMNIGLHPQFIANEHSSHFFVTREAAASMVQPVKKFAHKGDNGRALLIAGSEGKMGAAVLAARACIRTGAGLTTVHGPERGLGIVQTAVPEVMYSIGGASTYTDIVPEVPYDALGIGPGIGTTDETAEMFENVLRKNKSSLVLDADALNIISRKHELLSFIPPDSIITPHVKEFERLTKKADNDFKRLDLQKEYSSRHKLIVVLKGAHTCITLPDGRAFFNSTGNPGMARGGSGDALTGIILALLARKYSPEKAAILGVYLHGLAGDIAAEKKTVHGMIASDLVEAIAEGWKKLTSFHTENYSQRLQK